MLDGKNYKPGDPIYTFVAKDGTNVHVDAEKLRVWCAEHRAELQVLSTPVESEHALKFLSDNALNIDNLMKVSKMASFDPLIYGHDGTYNEGAPNVLLIDGHHRYFVAFARGWKWIDAYVLSPEQWHPFRIAGLDDFTEELLRAIPPKPTQEDLERFMKGE